MEEKKSTHVRKCLHWRLDNPGFVDHTFMSFSNLVKVRVYMEFSNQKAGG